MAASSASKTVLDETCLSNGTHEDILMEGIKDTTVQTEIKPVKAHIYGVNDYPPIQITIISGLQVAFLLKH